MRFGVINLALSILPYVHVRYGSHTHRWERSSPRSYPTIRQNDSPLQRPLQLRPPPPPEYVNGHEGSIFPSLGHSLWLGPLHVLSCHPTHRNCQSDISV